VFGSPLPLAHDITLSARSATPAHDDSFPDACMPRHGVLASASPSCTRGRSHWGLASPWHPPADPGARSPSWRVSQTHVFWRGGCELEAGQTTLLLANVHQGYKAGIFPTTPACPASSFSARQESSSPMMRLS